MIDEKKLIESLKTDFYEHYSINHSTDEKDLFEMFIDNINEQPKVNELIPVEKELPKEDGEYLVYYSCENDGSVGEDKECGYSVEYFDTEMESFGYWQNIFDNGTLGFVDSEFIEMHTAIAWMPLP